MVVDLLNKPSWTPYRDRARVNPPDTPREMEGVTGRVRRKSCSSELDDVIHWMDRESVGQ